MNWNEKKEKLLSQTSFSVEDLHTLVEILRSPDGCDWDRAQTHQSIRDCVINEAAEVAEAIEENDPQSMKEELGDLLFQVIFHSVIGKEQGEFTLQDVVNEICKKMIFRHPHVFAGEDKPDWGAIKAAEKALRAEGKW